MDFPSNLTPVDGIISVLLYAKVLLRRILEALDRLWKLNCSDYVASTDLSQAGVQRLFLSMACKFLCGRNKTIYTIWMFFQK